MQAARAAAVALLCLTATSQVDAGTPLPVIKYIQTEDAGVRSGPGDEFYVTQELSWGTKVEVYQQENGWCAIRPPEGSFSWVDANFVTPTADPSVGSISADDVFTRVGSNVVDRRDAEYTALKRGELVELLGVEENGSQQKWYKIAPPTGEFRWIEADTLANRPVSKLATQPRMVDRGLVRLTSHQQPKFVRKPRLASAKQHSSQTQTAAPTTMPAPQSLDPATTFASARPLQGIKTEPIPSLVSKPQPIAPARSVQQASSRSVGEVNRWKSRPVAAAADERQTAVEKHVAPDTASTTTNDPALDQIADLSIELSSIVSDDIANWDVDFVQAQTQYLLLQDLSPVARTRATNLLDRIDRFADVKLRYDQMQSLTVDTATTAWVEPVTTQTPQLEIDERITSMSRPSVGHPRSRAMQMLSRAAKSMGPQGTGVAQTEYNVRPTSHQVPASAAAVDLYAGKGVLMPVHTARADLPRFALTDRDGSVLSFVSPKGGLNLHRYLKKEVGIIGDQHHIQRGGSPHLLADRVVVLNRR